MPGAATRAIAPALAIAAAFVSISAGLVAMASFEFMLVPMKEELGLSLDAVNRLSKVFDPYADAAEMPAAFATTPASAIGRW